MSPEDATREALRARVLAVAGGADVRFEDVEAREATGRIIHYRIWVGPPGAAVLYAGRTFAEAADRAVIALTPDDPLPW